MKTAIVYCSRHGTTEKVAGFIAQSLRGREVHLLNLDEDPRPAIAPFDTVIIGGSIHMGRMQKKVQRFCESNLPLLLKKEVGLFICCMSQDKQTEEFENAFPEILRAHSKAQGILGGEFLFDQMNFLEKFIIRKVTKKNKSISQIDYAAIVEFAANLDRNKTFSSTRPNAQKVRQTNEK